MDIYLGPSDILTHDDGNTFTSRAFSRHCALINIKLDLVPKEAPQIMTSVERQHTSRHHAFPAISRASTPTTLEQTNSYLYSLRSGQILKMACKPVNDAVSHDVFVPKLLVYGEMHRFGVTVGDPYPTTILKALVSCKATNITCRAISFQIHWLCQAIYFR